MASVQLTIDVGIRTVYSGRVDQPTEIGRQSAFDTSQLYLPHPSASGMRIDIADDSATDLEGRLLLISPVAEDQVVVYNLSHDKTVHFASGAILPAGEKRQVTLPCVIALYSLTLELTPLPPGLSQENEHQQLARQGEEPAIPIRNYRQIFPPRVCESVASNPKLLENGSKEVSILRLKLAIAQRQTMGALTASAESSPIPVFRDLIRSTADEFEGTTCLHEELSAELMWGAPLEQPSYCRNAVEAAIAIEQRVRLLDRRLSPYLSRPTEAKILVDAATAHIIHESEGDAISCRATGDLQTRLDYLNLAFDIFHVDCIVTEHVVDDVSTDCAKRKLCRIKLPAPHGAVDIYELYPLDSESRRKSLDLYNQAMLHFEKYELPAALETLAHILRDLPNDKPTLWLLNRCAYFLSNPDDYFDPSLQLP